MNDQSKARSAAELTSTRDRVGLSRLIIDVTSEAARRLVADGAVLYLYDDAAGGLAPMASPTRSAGDVRERLDSRFHDMLLDTLFRGEVRSPGPADLAPWMEGKGVLLIPLITRRPVGVLAVLNPRHYQTPPHLLGEEAAERIDRALVSEQNSPFYQVLRAEGTGIAVVEGEMDVVAYASAEFRNSLGLVTTALLGRRLGDILPAPVHEFLMPLLNTVRRSGEVSARQYLEWHDDYGPRYFECQVIPGTDPDTYVVAVWPRTEETVTRQALQTSIVALSDSQRTLGAVLNNTNNGIFFIGPDLSVLYVNRRMGEMFGIDVQHTIGRNKRNVISNDIMTQMEDPEGFAARLSYLYDHMTEIAVDEVIVARPTRRILDRYSAPVFKDDGALLGRIEVYSDVTELRQLQHNKDEFLSLVSHELRTPVTSIKGYAQLLKRRAMQQPVSRQTMIAYDTIERQTVRMQDLIDTLLNLSRLETGRLQLDPAALDLVALTKHTVSLMKITAETHQFVLYLPDAPIWIEGDERRLEQVITNLLTNAVRYSPVGTAVTVAVAGDSEGVQLSVTDEGVGIAPDAQSRIFERFFRVEDAPESNGLGIGLYITRQFVEQHGGVIEVKSKVGVGSTFTVHLPRRLSRAARES